MNRISDEGLEFIKLWEGCKLKIYKDSAGYPTIGVGHLIVDGDPAEAWKHKGLTMVQAMSLLRDDVQHACNCVNNYITWPLGQHQFDALVSFTFNVGSGSLYRSTLRKKLNKGEEGAVGKELVRWNKAGGKINPGLTKRRRAEGRLFNLADYGTGP
jgi:GH24 family phage-related lysozyme (muramidase)